jgi:hypothetical protein
MDKTPFSNRTNFVEFLINKTWIVSVDDDEQVSIRLLKDSAIIVSAEQLPELIANTDTVSNEIAEQIYTLLMARFGR